MAIFRALTAAGYPCAFVDLSDAAGLTDRWRDAGRNVCGNAELLPLAALACQHGPAMLTEQDGFLSPTEVGLIVVHPNSPACPSPQARKGRAQLLVMSLAAVHMLAESLGVQIEVRPGWYAVLLAGNDFAAPGYLIPRTHTEAAA